MKHLILIGFLTLMACGQDGAQRVGNRASAAETGMPSPSAVAVSEQKRFWVTSPRLERRTCPSAQCGVVGQLFFREAAEVFERKGKWVRVSKTYDAACEAGRSKYVDTGEDSCSSANGITNGRFAEWALAENLSQDRPADPAEGASKAERLVAQSDDFSQYRAAFVKAADKLIRNGRCSAADFEEQGGWMKSSNHRDAPVYFTYCGGMTIANRIYLNANTGEVYQE